MKELVLELIKLPEGYIVTSKDWVKLSRYYDFITNKVNKNNSLLNADYVNTHYPTSWSKVVASTFHPELPQIEFDLSEDDAKKINFINIRILCNEDYKKYHLENETNTIDYVSGYFAGFQKAQSILSDNMFSLEQLRFIYDTAIFSTKEKLNYDEEFNRVIEFISKPKQYSILAVEENGKLKVTKILNF